MLRWVVGVFTDRVAGDNWRMGVRIYCGIFITFVFAGMATDISPWLAILVLGAGLGMVVWITR